MTNIELLEEAKIRLYSLFKDEVYKVLDMVGICRIFEDNKEK